MTHSRRDFLADVGTGMIAAGLGTGLAVELGLGSPVLADGKIYVAEVNGKFHILKPGPKKCEELHVQFFPSPDGVSAASRVRSAHASGGPGITLGHEHAATLKRLGVAAVYTPKNFQLNAIMREIVGLVAGLAEAA